MTAAVQIRDVYKRQIHEIAHAKLHAIDPNDPEQTNRPDSRTREVQALSLIHILRSQAHRVHEIQKATLYSV